MTDVESYLLFGERTIAGWLSPYTAEFIAAIGAVQRHAGLSGAVGEIGVHHGKLFVLLCLLLAANERAFAIDLFENQELNTDKSGRGDLDILNSNLRRWCPESLDRIEIIAKSSLEVEPREILDSCGPLRLISVDGGHTAECAYSDLKLSESVMSEHCVVALDDYFNEDWPDVSTGTARYILEAGSRLRPFAVTPNKLFLSAANRTDFYRDSIRRDSTFRPYKTSWMFGCEVDIFHGYPPSPPIWVYAREWTRNSAIGPHLLRLKRSLSGQRR